jgi:hypothetical protein
MAYGCRPSSTTSASSTLYGCKSGVSHEYSTSLYRAPSGAGSGDIGENCETASRTGRSARARGGSAATRRRIPGSTALSGVASGLKSGARGSGEYAALSGPLNMLAPGIRRSALSEAGVNGPAENSADAGVGGGASGERNSALAGVGGGASGESMNALIGVGGGAAGSRRNALMGVGGGAAGSRRNADIGVGGGAAGPGAFMLSWRGVRRKNAAGLGRAAFADAADAAGVSSSDAAEMIRNESPGATAAKRVSRRSCGVFIEDEGAGVDALWNARREVRADDRDAWGGILRVNISWVRQSDLGHVRDVRREVECSEHGRARGATRHVQLELKRGRQHVQRAATRHTRGSRQASTEKGGVFHDGQQCDARAGAGRGEEGKNKKSKTREKLEELKGRQVREAGVGALGEYRVHIPQR